MDVFNYSCISLFLFQGPAHPAKLYPLPCNRPNGWRSIVAPIPRAFPLCSFLLRRGHWRQSARAHRRVAPARTQLTAPRLDASAARRPRSCPVTDPTVIQGARCCTLQGAEMHRDHVWPPSLFDSHACSADLPGASCWRHRQRRKPPTAGQQAHRPARVWQLPNRNGPPAAPSSLARGNSRDTLTPPPLPPLQQGTRRWGEVGWPRRLRPPPRPGQWPAPPAPRLLAGAPSTWTGAKERAFDGGP